MRAQTRLEIEERKLDSSESLHVIENLVPPAEQRALHALFSKQAYRRISSDSRKTRHVQHWSKILPEHVGRAMDVCDRLERAARQAYGRPVAEVFRAYCNSISFGDVTYFHQDRPQGRDWITALYFVNPVWKREWAGETIFFDRHKEARACVEPRPGRGLLYGGRVWHRAGVPSRDFYGARLTLVFGFKLGR